jgi:hypothetical protein
MDRLNVKNILRRKKHKLQGNDYSYVMCAAQCEETSFHLLFSCPFSSACWRHLGINWRFDLDFHSIMEEASAHFHNKFFMDIFITRACRFENREMIGSSIALDPLFRVGG